MRNFSLVVFFTMFLLVGCSSKNELLNLPCENFFIESHDDFDKQVLFMSNVVSLKDLSGNFIGYLKFNSADLKLFYIDLKLSESICVDTNTKITFLFEDKNTTEYFCKSENNCEGKILIAKPFVTELQNKKLEGFRVKIREGYLDFYLDEESKLSLNKTSECYFKIANQELKR